MNLLEQLAEITRNVDWIERRMARRISPREAAELLARLQFEKRLLEQLSQPA